MFLKLYIPEVNLIALRYTPTMHREIVLKKVRCTRLSVCNDNSRLVYVAYGYDNNTKVKLSIFLLDLL